MKARRPSHNSTASDASRTAGTEIIDHFSPPEYIVVVNALFYASLGVNLLVAFFAILIRAWVQEFDRGLQAMSNPEQRAKTREFRYLGMERWKLPEAIVLLPLLILLSLTLLCVGLLLLLFHTSKPSFLIITVIFGVGIFYYATTTNLAAFATSSPFRSPLSRVLHVAYRNWHTNFYSNIIFFLFSLVDVNSATFLGRLRVVIVMVLQKLRPYNEREFGKPIGATTMDEVQLSTAASALRRVHDSVPDSQYSETLQSSVWQIAGSPTLPIPPLFDMPSWIYDRVGDREYLMRLPLDKVVALVATSLRMGDKRVIKRLSAAKSVLQPMDLSRSPWGQLVYWVFNLVLESEHYDDDPMKAESKALISTLHWNELHEEETIWLLNTLSDVHSRISLKHGDPVFIGICLRILSCQAAKWSDEDIPNIALLEAVIAFAAILCSPDITYRRKILINRHQYPWLLLNLRNPELIRNVIEGAPDSCHKQLISLLFLVLYALMLRKSYGLTPQYFSIITETGDFRLYTSALTAIAPAIGDVGLSTIARMLLAPRTQILTPRMVSTLFKGRGVQEKLLRSYDHRLGANENPDPKMFAILLLLSKQLLSSVINQLHDLDLKLENPWLKLAARVIARLDIPDGSTIYTGPFRDHGVHNMIAALSLRRYAEAKPTQYTESLLLASFLGSRELAVSELALEYYMKTVLSHSDPSAPSCHFSGAVRAVFNLLLPNHQLQMGWSILDMFANGFERLSVEWRRAFAEAFFTRSCRPSPKLGGDIETSTSESVFERILTWEYFHEEERESEFTDSCFSGLDWMVMAWSLHLSQQSGTGQPREKHDRKVRVHPWLMRDSSSVHFTSFSMRLHTIKSFRSSPSFVNLFNGLNIPSTLNTIAGSEHG